MQAICKIFPFYISLLQNFHRFSQGKKFPEIGTCVELYDLKIFLLERDNKKTGLYYEIIPGDAKS